MFKKASLPHSPHYALLSMWFTPIIRALSFYPKNESRLTQSTSNTLFNKQNIPILHFLHQEHTVIHLYPSACPVNSRKTFLHTNHPKLLSCFLWIMRKQIIISREVCQILRFVISNSIDLQIPWNAYTHIFSLFQYPSERNTHRYAATALYASRFLPDVARFPSIFKNQPSNRTFIRIKA